MSICSYRHLLVKAHLPMQNNWSIICLFPLEIGHSWWSNDYKKERIVSIGCFFTSTLRFCWYVKNTRFVGVYEKLVADLTKNKRCAKYRSSKFNFNSIQFCNQDKFGCRRAISFYKIKFTRLNFLIVKSLTLFKIFKSIMKRLQVWHMIVI